MELKTVEWGIRNHTHYLGNEGYKQVNEQDPNTLETVEVKELCNLLGKHLSSNEIQYVEPKEKKKQLIDLF